MQLLDANKTLTSRRLPKLLPVITFVASLIVATTLMGLISANQPDSVSIGETIGFGLLLYIAAMLIFSLSIEGKRRTKDRFLHLAIMAACAVAIVPLGSVGFTTVVEGLARLDGEFLNSSMRNIVGEGGGALHALTGTLLITGTATLISVPLGILTAFYLVEIGRGKIARTITILVDIMTGIPSIVAGLFAYTVFSLILGPGTRMGFIGAISLAILMVPIVIRSSEEMFRLVPQELREASYALGVPQWRTALKVVLPTALPGVTSGVVLSIARVIGETAPLLITAGFTANMNLNIFQDRMQSLPVYIYTQFTNQGNPAFAFMERAWAAALLLILIVLVLNVAARSINRLSRTA